MKAPDKFKEYIWLINTIYRAKRISLPEIQQKWLETEMSGGVEIARATFIRHKAAIEDMFGIFIVCDRKNDCKYYIGNEEVLCGSSLQNWMLSTLSVSNIVSESLALQDRILLQPAPVEGEYLQKIIDAMKQKVRIRITYQKYGSDVAKEYEMEPYCIKLFEQRWYVLGHFDDNTSTKKEKDYFATFSFDRIKQLSLTLNRFEVDKTFDVQSFFNEFYGVLTDKSVPLERIVLRAYGKERFYLRDLPIHHSQHIVTEGTDYIDFELNLRPTPDFVTFLFGKSTQVKVISPQSLAQKVLSMINEVQSLYSQK